MSRRILVTSALPYANGPIHLGHLVEYIQTDIWVRFQKLQGNEVYYFCADDTHGTPVMIAARNRGISPEDLVGQMRKAHFEDLTSFQVEFDNYYSTNTPENRALAEEIYLKAKEKGHIHRETLNQLYCAHDDMFLPDRFVRGICPRCGAEDQYGDSCEVCGSTYRPEDLKQSRCAICGTPPVQKESEHIFFKLDDFQTYLEDWLKTHNRVDQGIRKKMHEWIDQGLRHWDISRDGPYFGFAIPGEQNKFFYVWLDAPIGYIASSLNFFRKTGKDELFDAFWRSEEHEVYHFIGKDIAYFHTLFWPAVLHAGDFRTPTSVFVHGFLTVNGEKMSKSRGTFVRASTFLKHMDPECLRYFYATRLGPGLDDLDLNTGDFVARYNSDVVGNVANLFSRLVSGIASKLDLRLSEGLSAEGKKLFAEVSGKKETIAAHFEKREYARAVREIQALSDSVNRFISEKEPWKQIKEDAEAARQTVTDAINAGMVLSLYLKPILPVLSGGVEELLALENPLTFLQDLKPLPPHHELRKYRHLAGRIETAAFDAIFEEERSAAAEAKKEQATGAGSSAAGNSQGGKNQKSSKKAGTAKSDSAGEAPVEDSGIITIDDLEKVELRVGRILSAELIEGADRLLRVQLDVGEEKPRNVIAGIRSAYSPEDLKDLFVVCVANLKPRKMKFGTSEAMLLATGKDDGLTLFVPHRNARPGDRLG
ncbi:MAG: methionine--tRNA ligase [Leptospiraceae bacterium]|nr:methionine--tRNA ligase [Leptospiraceae bacterium]